MDINQKVLIVDDDKFSTMILKRLISGKVQSVEHVSSGEEAIDKINSGNYDLVFLDLNLPQKSGIDVMNEVRDAHASTRFIGISADKKRSSKMMFEQAGISCLLEKPINSQEILNGQI